LGRARRTGIKRNHAVFQAAPEKENHVDGDHQAIPLGIAKLEAGQRTHSPRHPFELHALTAEQNRARLTGAEKLAACQLDEVGVQRRQSNAAQLATLLWTFAPRKLTQRAESRVCELSCAHD